MRKIKLILVFLSVLVFIFSSSCSRRVLDFTLISSKNVDLTKGATFKRGTKRVDGSDKVHIILLIPTGVANLKEALDEAIECTPGCVALLDGVVYYKFWYIPLLYGQQTAVIEGTPLIDPALASSYNITPKYRKIKIDNKGVVKSVEMISSAEYLALKNKLAKTSAGINTEN
ncbi:MAG: hypothetical protein GXO47_02770 [Chlorobi bacterium]|nr:hypothetical protein [Chlorobiota bacterium]